MHVASSSASTWRAVRPSVPRRQKLSPPAVVLLPPRERRRHRPARRPLGDDLFDKIEARLRHVHDAGRLARVFEPHEDVSGAHQPAREAGEGERVGHHRTDRGAGLVVWVLRGISRRDIKVKNKGGEAMDRIGPNVALFLGARVVAFRGAVFGGYALSPPAPGWRSAARARTWAPGRRAHRWAWRGRLVSCALAARASTRACAPRRASVAGFQRGSPPRRGARAAGGSSRGRPAGAYR